MNTQELLDKAIEYQRLSMRMSSSYEANLVDCSYDTPIGEFREKFSGSFFKSRRYASIAKSYMLRAKYGNVIDYVMEHRHITREEAIKCLNRKREWIFKEKFDVDPEIDLEYRISLLWVLA